MAGLRNLESQRVWLGVCPSNRRGRVPGPAGADARRRDAGDVVAHRRVAPTKQMSPPGRNPKGAWGLHDDRCVARRQRCATTSPPPRALRSPCKPHARDPFYYSDKLLARISCRIQQIIAGFADVGDLVSDSFRRFPRGRKVQ